MAGIRLVFAEGALQSHRPIVGRVRSICAPSDRSPQCGQSGLHFPLCGHSAHHFVGVGEETADVVCTNLEILGWKIAFTFALSQIRMLSKVQKHIFRLCWLFFNQFLFDFYSFAFKTTPLHCLAVSIFLQNHYIKRHINCKPFKP